MDLRHKDRDSGTNSDEKSHNMVCLLMTHRFSDKIPSLFGHAHQCSGLCLEGGCIENLSYRPFPSLKLLTFQKASNHSSSFGLGVFPMCDTIVSISYSHNSDD